MIEDRTRRSASYLYALKSHALPTDGCCQHVEEVGKEIEGAQGDLEPHAPVLPKPSRILQ